MFAAVSPFSDGTNRLPITSLFHLIHYSTPKTGILGLKDLVSNGCRFIHQWNSSFNELITVPLGKHTNHVPLAGN